MGRLESFESTTTARPTTRGRRRPARARWTRATEGGRADARVRSVSVVGGVGADEDRCRRRRRRWMSARSIGRRIDARRAGTSRGCGGRWSDRRWG